MLANKILLISSKLTTKINNQHYAHNELMFDIPNNMTVNGQQQYKQKIICSWIRYTLARILSLALQKYNNSNSAQAKSTTFCFPPTQLKLNTLPLRYNRE